jgi:hypothetical protein
MERDRNMIIVIIPKSKCAWRQGIGVLMRRWRMNRKVVVGFREDAVRYGRSEVWMERCRLCVASWSGRIICSLWDNMRLRSRFTEGDKVEKLNTNRYYSVNTAWCWRPLVKVIDMCSEFSSRSFKSANMKTVTRRLPPPPQYHSLSPHCNNHTYSHSLLSPLHSHFPLSSHVTSSKNK